MLTALEFASGATELHSRLARAVFATCGRWDLAEDSAQEALLRAWQHLDRGGELRSLEAWTMSVAVKNALFHGRSALARKLSDSAAPRDGEGTGGGALDVGHR